MITNIKIKSTRSYYLIIIFCLFLTFSLFLISYFIKKSSQFKDKIYPNVYIDNLDYANKNKSDVVAYFDKKNRLLQSVRIQVIFNENIEATISGNMLSLQYPSKTLADRAFSIGRSEYLITSLYQKTSALFKLKHFKITSRIDYNKNIIDQLISDLEEKYDEPAKNALFKFKDNKVVNFRKEKTGQAVDTKKIYEDVAKIISSLKNNIKDNNLTIRINQVVPEITLAHANDFGIEEEIAEGVSDFTHSDQDRIYNLTLAASRMNGVLMPKDKIFSFNEAIGEISMLTGYKRGYVIKEGKTILDDGGGVCQVSTTLFRAVLNAGLPIIERRAHAYRVGYYENGSQPGFDATIYPPYADLKIKNDTPGAILIQTEIDQDNNLLYFRLFGKKDRRRTEITNYKMWDSTPPPDPQYQDAPNMKKGETKQIETAHWGLKTNFDYTVYKDDKIIFQTNFFSNFRPWKAIYLIGTAD